ncbi:hypothetical protein LguiA_033333 [Lonicera macranthoides]
MVNPLVERATSDMLIGPDWAMNLEICDICNHDPSQAKDVIKGIKKRLKSKNPKVQLLALTLLETLVKNCGDIVHMYVAETDVLHEMVKIVRKKVVKSSDYENREPDFRVKEKVLVLIDSWQEAFGGARGRHTQYFAAYQELLRMGAVFPQRSENSAPVFTPPQSRPLKNYPQSRRNPEHRKDDSDSSAEDEFPTLSLTELQNARGLMDVLAEMLSALGPENKEELRQEVIVDLVDQCRTYKQRVVHLVNSTSDESLLCQGLALNDDLQRLLAKHEALVSGAAAPKLKPKPKPEPVQVPPTADSLLIDTGGDGKQHDRGSTSSASSGTQVPHPAPKVISPTPAKPEPKIDLLSGDDFGSPKAENSLAIVPVGANQQPPSPVATPQNALALVDMFSQNGNAQSPYPGGQTYPNSSPQFQNQPNFQSPQSPFYSNGSVHNMVVPYDQALYAQGVNHPWNGQITLQQQPNSPVYGGQTSGAFPPPPWEVQSADNSHLSPTHHLHHPHQNQQMEYTQVVITHSRPALPQSPTDPTMGTYMQPLTTGVLSAINNQTMHVSSPTGGQGAQSMGMMVPHPMHQQGQMGYYPQQMYGNQMPDYGYGYGQHGQGYGQQQQNVQFLEQRMSGLSMSELGYPPTPASAPAPAGKAKKPEDKLFGDLVDLTKFKPAQNSHARAGSM